MTNYKYDQDTSSNLVHPLKRNFAIEARFKGYIFYVRGFSYPITIYF